MAKKKRVRRTGSISNELLAKSRESALSAVQIFNSPLISFKSEIFIVLMNISWTYLLHAYYRKEKIEYRYFKQAEKRRVFDKTASGADKYWELKRCLDDKDSPIDKNAANNLRFLIGIRHEIEHQMTTRIDSTLSAKFQACCLNYNHYAKKLFGDQHGIEKHLAFSLQFSSIDTDQVKSLPSMESMPAHIKSYIEGFEGDLTEVEYNSPQFAYRVLFVPKMANRKGQADEVIEFVKAGTEFADDVNAKYTLIKETERPKHRPSDIVRKMKADGFNGFGMHQHIKLWKSNNAKELGKSLGVEVGKQWLWYDSWVEIVRKHCHDNSVEYGKA